MLAIILLGLSAATNVLARHAVQDLNARDCTSNNCVRAVRGDSFPQRMGAADCASYLAYTASPATSTVYVTSTSTGRALYTNITTPSTTITKTSFGVTTVTTGASTTVLTFSTTVITSTVSQIFRRQAQSTAYPAYASACGNFAAYSSACSCIGVTGSTVTAVRQNTTVTQGTTVSDISTLSSTAATSTSTINTISISTSVATSTTLLTSTTLVTSTSTLTSSAPTPTNFRLKIQGAHFNGQYVALANDQDTAYQNLVSGSSTPGPEIFRLDPATNYLILVSSQGSRLSYNSVQQYGFVAPDGIFTPYVCTIPGSLVLFCRRTSTSGPYAGITFSESQTSKGQIFFYDSASQITLANESPITLKIEYVQ